MQRTGLSPTELAAQPAQRVRKWLMFIEMEAGPAKDPAVPDPDIRAEHRRRMGLRP